MDTKERIKEFRKRLTKTREQKGFTQEKLSESIGKSYQSVGDWERGTKGKTPNLKDCLLMCEVLDTDLDFLLGYTDVPNNKIAYIREHTGLTDENIKMLIQYNKNREPMNEQRLNAINALLSNEHGLQIIENMAAYASVDVDSFIIDTPYGAHGGPGDDFALVGIDSNNEIAIRKEDLPKIFLTAIMTELEKWRESEQKKKTKATRKKAREG